MSPRRTSSKTKPRRRPRAPEITVRQAIHYALAPWEMEERFPVFEEREAVWRAISRKLERMDKLDPLAAEALRVRQRRAPRISTSEAARAILNSRPIR